jgi:hypothetical protein
MPPFAGVLNDAQVAGLLRWMRDSGRVERPGVSAVSKGAPETGREIQAAHVNALRSLPVD